jgi:spermidine synthase
LNGGGVLSFIFTILGEGRYDLISISAILFFLYGITLLFSRKKLISVASHRKIWNILLLVTFLASAGFGTLLVIRLNTGWEFELPFNMLYWHVEAGVAMFLIALFHIAWHWRYFKNILMMTK